MKKTIPLGWPWLLKENEENLIKRLHDIISGSGNGPFKKDSGMAWQLDGTNDWWAEVNEGKLTICSRYGGERFHTLISFCKIWFS